MRLLPVIHNGAFHPLTPLISSCHGLTVASSAMAAKKIARSVAGNDES
jgi:hypothetical protein